MAVYDKKPELPKVVYVYVHEDGEDFWFNAESDIEGCASPNKKRIVGKYELKELAEIELEIKETVIKKVIA